MDSNIAAQIDASLGARQPGLLRLRSNPAVLLVGLTWLLVVAGFMMSGLRVDGLGGKLALAAILLLIAAVYGTLRPAPVLAECAGYGALWILFTVGGCIVTYLAGMSGLPLQDDIFHAGDKALGFDWVTWTEWVHAQPALNMALFWAYDSLLLQIGGSVIILASVRPRGRNRELLVAAALGLMITSAVFALMPALGPFARFPLPGTPPELLLYIPHLEALRGEGPYHFVVGELQGIIVLPSYHTVLGLLFIWAHRGLRWSFLPVLLLNIAMLASVPSVGGHYITDLLAGVAVAVLAILGARFLVPLTDDRTSGGTTTSMHLSAGAKS